ncbi:MAG: hypothetical protein GX790_10355, partial [Syntrophomonadaceae bacterium]|nr:hypothetical protein [Syntrophomonadaceae bacterium]
MKRDYNSGEHEDVTYFVGYEVEKTPAYGKKTLFDDHECDHIFFGANHSFDPKDADEWYDWDNLICHFLDAGVLCSLDIPVKHAEEFLECRMVEHSNFSPQLRVPVPFIKQWNYNTMIKIDDKDFNHSNPGVWCHRLHDLMSYNT